MKLRFKQQQFQINAVQAVVDCFAGQPFGAAHYMVDRGKWQVDQQLSLGGVNQDFAGGVGFKNKEVQLFENEVLDNIRRVQLRNGLTPSDQLAGRYNLTIEMETGTGKTYTYIRTMFELFRKYGWSKYIVVVPSIAIREGVYKSFQIIEDHFMREYGHKARYFIYNSKQLHNIESFSSDAGLNVMVINSQAFNARGKDARRIYMELDEFQSRRPIDVIARNNPIMIIDEPQSVEGAKTKDALKAFNPLFTLRYSATHREDYNKIYRLDALDAYNQKLVKKISVKGIAVTGSTGTESYLYLEGIDLSAKKAPIARLELEIKTAAGIKRYTKKVQENDDLYQLSGNLQQYKGYRVAQINGADNTIIFSNGVRLGAGEVRGDVNELNLRRIQIRETIQSHLEKESELFTHGIKVLSLFFIDEVANYRKYDQAGNRADGVYAQIFMEEYERAVEEYTSRLFNQGYINYLQGIRAEDTHNGYFSIDKKSGQMINSRVSARETDSDDVDAYGLIMKDKERLLDLAEPTRFIFSHSALKEGWDNPNVFQICTLKHSGSNIRKRQEVGRGMRLCVNRDGERIDSSIPGIDVHVVNVLTVVCSESYENFAKQLQNEIAETLSDRPQKADVAYFLNRVVTNERGEKLIITEHLAKKLNKLLYKHDLLDEDDNPQQAYYEVLENDQLPFELPEELNAHQKEIIGLLKSVFNPDYNKMVGNERANNIKELKPNDNFKKKEFQELWKRINKKTAYTVKFDSGELIGKCIASLDAKLEVPPVQYRVIHGEMTSIVSKEQLARGEAFNIGETETGHLYGVSTAAVKYDLVGKLIDETRLTRKTIVQILSGMSRVKFSLFRQNPEEFIIRAARLINEEKATTIIERITYNVISETFDNEIFTRNNLNATVGQNAIPVNHHIYDYVIIDSKVEKDFASALDTSREVQVYAKLPRGFFIPTPVGDYNPDWAIVFKEGNVKYIYFVAETKGTLDTLELTGVENAKIHCARKHFECISTPDLKYDVVDSYEKLMELVKA